MTANELQKVIDYLDHNVTKHETEYFDEAMNNFVTKPSVEFNELFKLLANYPIEEPKACCAPNYEAMYNELHAAHNDLKKKNKELKDEVRILEHKLACAKGAIAMVEVIYGRQWAPGKLELIR